MFYHVLELFLWPRFWRGLFQNVQKYEHVVDSNAERMGWEWAPDLKTAIEMAKDTAPPSPQITMLHHPPIVVTQVR